MLVHHKSQRVADNGHAFETILIMEVNRERLISSTLVDFKMFFKYVGNNHLWLTFVAAACRLSVATRCPCCLLSSAGRTSSVNFSTSSITMSAYLIATN